VPLLWQLSEEAQASAVGVLQLEAGKASAVAPIAEVRGEAMRAYDIVTLLLLHALVRADLLECRSYPLEIGALGDGEPLEVTPQAVKAELDGAETYPIAPAIDA